MTTTHTKTAIAIQILDKQGDYYQLGENIALSIFAEAVDRTADADGRPHVTTPLWAVEEWMGSHEYTEQGGFAGWGRVFAREVADEDGDGCRRLLAVSTYEIATPDADHPEVSAKVSHIDRPERLGDGCYCDYTVELTVGDHTYELPGWAVCGWLRPGAHADLDGSGLANWGSSQPGGWTSCAGDGATNGKPRVDDSPAEYGDPIPVGGVEGRDGVEIGPEVWPAWAEAVAGAQRARQAEEAAYAAGMADMDEAAYDALADAADAAEKAADILRDRLFAAIEEALPDCPAIPEPESNDVFEELRESDVPGVRMGDYLGAGLVLAWRDGEEYRSAYWPDEDDIRRAVEDASEAMVADLVADLERATKRLEEW